MEIFQYVEFMHLNVFLVHNSCGILVGSYSGKFGVDLGHLESSNGVWRTWFKEDETGRPNAVRNTKTGWEPASVIRTPFERHAQVGIFGCRS